MAPMYLSCALVCITNYLLFSYDLHAFQQPEEHVDAPTHHFKLRGRGHSDTGHFSDSTSSNKPAANKVAEFVTDRWQCLTSATCRQCRLCRMYFQPQ